MRNLIFATVAASVGVLTATGAAHAAERWTCNVFFGPSHYINDVLKPWGEEVGKVTNGEVRINFLPASAAPPPKQIDGIVAGTFDCAAIFVTFAAKRAAGPMFGILPLYSRGNGETGSVAYYRTWSKHFADKKEFADDNVHILSMFQFPSVQIWTATDKPIDSVEDLKSQKMWALAGPVSRTMEALGVHHVSGPAARVAEFTQTKVIQGIGGITAGGIINYAGIQFPKSATITGKALMPPSFAWMVSKRKWDALTDEQRRAITAISGEKLGRDVGKAADDFEKESMKRLEEAGVKIVKASPAFEAELEKAAAPQVDAWTKRVKSLGVDGRKVLQEFDRIVGELGS